MKVEEFAEAQSYGRFTYVFLRALTGDWLGRYGGD